MDTRRLLSFFSALNLFLCLSAQNFNTPPNTPVRTMAEWEELQALNITWKGNNALSILAEITRAARLECMVVINCDNQTTVNSAKNYLISKNVDISSNVAFHIATNNSVWVRDYGPNCVYANDVDSLLLVDWLYNRRTRTLDNAIPQKLGEYFQLPVYSTAIAPYDLVNTGGNFMADGMGTAFASKLIFRNNDQIMNGEGSDPNDVIGTSNHTEASIDNIMQEFMGIDRYIKMEELPYDGIHHIDMHMKLLDEETILVGEYPAGTSDGPQIEANIQYVLSGYKTAYGQDFKQVRVPMPPYNGQHPPIAGDEGRYPTYANAVFVNRTIIMPSYNNPLDAAAIDTFQKYMPGYTIVPVNCNSIISSGGAVHCITKEIGVNAPLLINHSVLPCQESALPNYEVLGQIQHRSGIAAAKVYFTTDLSGAWQSVDMQGVTSGTPNTWKANIPKQDSGSAVYYYIEATANNGKTLTRPLTAPAGYWSFCVKQFTSAGEPLRLGMTDIYPNPASAITVVPLNSNKKVDGRILLVNLQGQVVETIYSGEIPAGKHNYFFNAAKHVPGVYFVDLQANGIHTTQKVLIR
jgi:agmatine deiminase